MALEPCRRMRKIRGALDDQLPSYFNVNSVPTEANRA